MVALWMCYATLVTALLAVGAWAADGALALLGRPRRWAWAAAVVGGLALPAGAAWQATRPARPVVASAVRRAGSAAVYLIDVGSGGAPGRARPADAPVVPQVAVVPAWGARAVASAARAFAPWDRPLLALWLLASVAGVGLVARGAWAVRRRRRGWRAAVIAGERVWLAPDLGPALVGALRPRVVLPTWVLDALDAGELRLVLAHERAHAAARDPLLLAFALGAVVVAPWNAALWLAARRLRLAAEADCDRRVLRAHPGARRYARLLVDVAERALGTGGRGAGALATALLDPPGLLERRVGWLLGAERAGGARRAPRVAGAALGAAGVVGLACAVPRPVTAPRVSDTFGAATQLDAAAVHRAQLARIQMATDSVGRAQTPELGRMRAAVESVGRLQQAQFVRAQALYEALRQARDTGAAPRPRVDSLFERVRATGRALAGDPQAKARFDSTVDALRDEVERHQHAQLGAPRRGLIPGALADSGGYPDRTALRDLVARHFPQALIGGMGPKPYVWFAVDAQGHVLHTATGPAGLGSEPLDAGFRDYDSNRVERVAGDVAPAGRRLVLDAQAGHLKFPDLPADDIASSTWTNVRTARDTVQVFIIASKPR